MELPVRLPVLPPQCYSPSSDHFEGPNGISASRQPLQESTGNAQHPHMAWYAQHLEAFSSVPPSVPTPPILRTQSLGPEYGTPPDSRSQQRLGLHLHARPRLHATNPLMPLLTQAFQNYRKKQADKPDQKWPDVLEGPFLDALLLIPQMRRKKYAMKEALYGRNMLIGEYLWIAYCQTLPPGVEPDPQMARERKKVSSHIQVLKHFFSNHRCFHFFFGQRHEDKDKDNIETVSLKKNPVLIALSQGRLPDERPNYEYFAQILALNDQVQVRPKRCWIFVSHQDVVVGEDGSGYVAGTGDKLGESEYPHLARNLERESWAKEEQQIFKGALLHEFTKEMHQVESSSVRELSRKWESAFPELHKGLKAITSTTTDARCDILHMHVTLELKEKRRFPSRSELNSWVEINIEQPRLLNHRWRVDTRLARPPELSYSHEDSAPEVLYKTSDEIAIQYQHRPGCDARGRHCDCISQGSRRDWVTVPFPADVWALTLTNCAEYPAHPFSDNKRHGRERETAGKTGDDGVEEPRTRRRNRQPTQMDLVPKIAMTQELWSCPPDPLREQGSAGSKNQRWTRRALIIWTFETIHSIEDGKLVTAQGGRTNWRFLTILDPASEDHQRDAIVSGRRPSADEYADSVSRLVSRGVVMSPNPSYQQHLSASMSENFSSVWDSSAGLGPLSTSAIQAAYSAHVMAQQAPSHTAAVQTGYGLLNSFSSHGGLETPPPSASLTSSFARAFDAVSTTSQLVPSYLAPQVTASAAGLATSSHGLGGAPSAMTDPFLADVGAAYDETQDSIHSWNTHGVGSGADPGVGWPPGYPGTGGSHVRNGTVSWPGSQSQATPASARLGREQASVSMSVEQHHHSRPQPPQQRPPLEQHQPWVSDNSAGADNHDLWAPAPCARHTPAEAAAPRHGSLDHQQSTTATAPRDASHDWVQIHAPPSTASGSELSQDWEVIAALPETEHPLPSASALLAEDDDVLHDEGRGQPKVQVEVPAEVVTASSSQTQPKSFKRARSAGSEDDEDGYRRQRPRS